MVNEPSLRILVIDDDEEIVEIIKITLELDGYEINYLHKGNEVIPYLKSQLRPDLILLDLFLAGSDGKTICKEIKANSETASIPIILVSANMNLSKTVHDVGADDYLNKPFELSMLSSKVKALLNKG